jgi:predicted transcriptional regulator YdeE
VYKGASRNLQRKIGRDTSKRIRPFKPMGKRQIRKWWYPVIAHHHSLSEIASHYGRTFPTWLASEIERLSTSGWLDRYSRKTGAPKGSHKISN